MDCFEVHQLFDYEGYSLKIHSWRFGWYQAIIREGLKKKTIESVIMIIAGRGGGSAGGDHIPLGFFSMLET